MDREDGSASGSAYDSPFGKDDFDTYEFDDGIELDLPDLSRHPVEAPEDAVARANSVPPKPVMRMVPRTGRTQHVKGGDLARAFQLLSSDITRNQVAREASKQRFHERPGLKRKRVASERWQRKFKGGFKGTLRRVSALVSQGW